MASTELISCAASDVAVTEEVATTACPGGLYDESGCPELLGTAAGGAGMEHGHGGITRFMFGVDEDSPSGNNIIEEWITDCPDV